MKQIFLLAGIALAMAACADRAAMVTPNTTSNAVSGNNQATTNMTRDSDTALPGASTNRVPPLRPTTR